jgi:hypothetical protein
MAQTGQNPAFDDLHADFDFGFLSSQQLPVMRAVLQP